MKIRSERFRLNKRNGESISRLNYNKPFKYYTKIVENSILLQFCRFNRTEEKSIRYVTVYVYIFTFPLRLDYFSKFYSFQL